MKGGRSWYRLAYAVNLSERHTVTNSHVLKQERHTPTAANERASTRTHARAHTHTHKQPAARIDAGREAERSEGPGPPAYLSFSSGPSKTLT